MFVASCIVVGMTVGDGVVISFAGIEGSVFFAGNGVIVGTGVGEGVVVGVGIIVTSGTSFETIILGITTLFTVFVIYCSVFV
jgi:hypothetical protein